MSDPVDGIINDETEPLLPKTRRRDSSSTASVAQLIADKWSFKGCRCCIGFLGFLGILFLCGSLALMLTFRLIVDFIVRKVCPIVGSKEVGSLSNLLGGIENVVLAPGSQIYETWRDPPIPIYFKIHFFNITNEHEYPWINNKPVVEEVGPYVFREEWHRDNIRFFGNDTLTYTKMRRYHFEPSLSNGDLDDVVHTLNIPLLAAAYQFKSSGRLVKFALASVFRLLHESIVSRHTVNELSFEGYDDPLIKVGKEIFKTYPFSKFAFFYNKNGSVEANYNIFTGVGDSSKFTEINNVNGLSSLDTWSSDWCNMINGTDGSSFPPLLDPSSRLYIYIKDFCRSFAFDYSDTVTRFTMPVDRFVPAKHLLDNGTDCPDNECFCSGQCLKSGVYNLTRCQYGAPLFVSFPHFLDADPSYLDGVMGLSPNQSLHQPQIIVEPETGVPVQAFGRFQINAYLERIPGLPPFESTPNVLFPLIWFEESSELTQDLADQLSSVTKLPYYYGRIVSYSLLALGLVLGIASILYFIVIRTHATTN